MFNTISRDPLRVLGKDMTLVVCQFSITGVSGAVDEIKNTGFGATSIEGLRGTVVRDSTGQYTITLPGRGTWPMIAPVSVQTTGSADVRGRFEVVNTTTGAVTVQFLDAANAADDPADTEVVSVVLLVSQFNHL